MSFCRDARLHGQSGFASRTRRELDDVFVSFQSFHALAVPTRHCTGTGPLVSGVLLVDYISTDMLMLCSGIRTLEVLTKFLMQSR